MKMFTVIGLVAASIAGCSAPTAGNSDLQGLWSSDARTKGGLGSQWSFTNGGQVTTTFGAVVDFTYQIEGNRIKTVFLESGKPPQETSEEFVLAGDTLTLNPNDDQNKQVMKRMGTPVSGVHPIVGEWTYQHYTGGQAITRYSRKGAMQLSVPFRTLTGSYSVAASRVTIRLEGQQPAEVGVQVSGAKMVMKNGSSENAFTKFEF